MISAELEAAMSFLKLRAFGDHVGLIRPPETVARLNLRVGDTLYAVDTPDGVQLTTNDPEFERQMEVGRRIMKRSHAVLRELAKS
jgi:putative addiction module antidote